MAQAKLTPRFWAACALASTLLAACHVADWPPRACPADFYLEVRTLSLAEEHLAEYTTRLTADSLWVREHYNGFEAGFAIPVPRTLADSVYHLLRAAQFFAIQTPQAPDSLPAYPGSVADHHLIQITAQGRTLRIYQHIHPHTGQAALPPEYTPAYHEGIEALMRTLRPVIQTQSVAVPVLITTQVLGQEHDVGLRLNGYDMLPHQHLTLTAPSEITDTLLLLPGHYAALAQLLLEHTPRAQAVGTLRVATGRAAFVHLHCTSDSIRIQTLP